MSTANCHLCTWVVPMHAGMWHTRARTCMYTCIWTLNFAKLLSGQFSGSCAMCFTFNIQFTLLYYFNFIYIFIYVVVLHVYLSLLLVYWYLLTFLFVTANFPVVQPHSTNSSDSWWNAAVTQCHRHKFHVTYFTPGFYVSVKLELQLNSRFRHCNVSADLMCVHV